MFLPYRKNKLEVLFSPSHPLTWLQLAFTNPHTPASTRSMDMGQVKAAISVCFLLPSASSRDLARRCAEDPFPTDVNVPLLPHKKLSG